MDSSNPLLRAVFLRRLRLTRLLLDGGAYVNESDGLGVTPLMVACRTKHVDAQSSSRAKLVQFLLEKGADPNIQDKEGFTALMHACREQAGAEVVRLLVDSGADLSLEDQSGTSALVHAVVAGDWKVLEVLLDSCKAKGKEVIIITAEKIPGGGKFQANKFPPLRPMEPSGAPASPSEVQLITSSRCSSTLSPPKPVFSFKGKKICGVSSHPCSPSRFRGFGQTASNGPLLRLNSEPWLKIPAPSQPEELSLKVPVLDQDKFRSSERGDPKEIPQSLLSSHSASHPNLHSVVASGRNPGSSSLQSVIQRRKLGEDIYSSDPQLAGDLKHLQEDQRTKKFPTVIKKVLPERRGSGTFFLERNIQARPRSLPPLTNTPILSVFNHGSASGFSESAQKGFLPSAPPGQPKDVTRRMLLRRHSIQSEQFKSSA